MKIIITLVAFVIAFGAKAQEKKVERIIEKVEIDCVIPLRNNEKDLVVRNIDDFYRTKITRPVAEFHSLNNWQLSQKLPFMHTINGSVYSFEFLRYQVRN